MLENRSVHSQVDDAYIFYRYARNWITGQGLVFNVGERVEGFSSPLWLLLIAAGMAAGAEAVALGHWLGVACGVLLLWLTYVYASQGLAPRERWVAALSSMLLYLALPFGMWSVSGLETPLFAAAVVATLIAESRGRPRLAVLGCAVTALARPEGVLLGMVIFAFLLRNAEQRKRGLVLLGAYLASLAVLTACRFAYYGSLLPNTYYAKVGGAVLGWGPFYIGRFIVQTLLPMLWPIRYGVRERYLQPGLWWTLAVFVFVAAVNGDTFAFSRFFLPALPALCALAVRGALLASRAGGRAARFAVLSIGACAVWFAVGVVAGSVVLAAAVVASWLWGGSSSRRAAVAGFGVLSVASSILAARAVEPPGPSESGARFFDLVVASVAVRTRWAELATNRAMWRFSDRLAQLAAIRLDARPPEEKLVAAVGIGAFGYYTSARILDIVGLVDPVIARSGPPPRALQTFALPGHQRTNAAYVLARKPDYILIPPPAQSEHLPAVLELWKDPELRSSYRWDESLPGFVKRKAHRPRRAGD
jgi:arabinofuranosyltransferase